MKILILWSSLSDYMISCFRQLSLQIDLELHLVHQPVRADAPYDPFDLSFFKTVTIDDLVDKSTLITKCLQIEPDAILMASWNYSHYMKISKLCKERGTYVISSFDGQWQGTIKQRIGVATSDIFLKPSIDNFLVPGDRQSNFARKLGFKNPMNGLYCANTSRFKEHKSNRPQKFLFIGRLVEMKGVKQLLEAYKIYRSKTKDPWNLIIAGVGPLEKEFQNVEGIELKGFVQPNNLNALFQEATCFILPSLHEPWGLVVHEAAVAGLIIICSYKVGASTWFVRDGQNGNVIAPDADSISASMLKVADSSFAQLAEMSNVSKSLGGLWTIEKWADYVYNYILNNTRDLNFNQK